MIETKFTPGPWTSGGSIYKHMAAEIRHGEAGEPIAQVWKNEHSFANAHLIAAAPAMYQALRYVLAHSGDPVLEDVAKAALEIAEGR